MAVGHYRGPGRLRGGAAALVLLSLVAAGCGGGRSTPDVTQVPEAATEADPELRAEARDLQGRWEEAERRGLSFYAPEHMARASEQVEALDEMARSGAEEDRIREGLDELERHLDAAERAKARADSLAGPLLERWGLLRELAGDGAVEEARPEALEALRDAMRRIEDGEDPGDAAAAAERRLAEAQAEVLDRQLLAPVRRRIGQLEDEGVGERAPRSLRRARSALEEARAALERAPFDLPAATRRAWRAGDAAERAHRVSDRVRRLQELDAPDLERQVLAELRHLERSAELLGGGVAAGRSVEEALQWQGRQLDRLRNRRLEAAAARASGPSGRTEGLEMDLVAVPGWLERPAAARNFSAPAVPPPPAGRMEAVRDPPPPVRIDSGTDPSRTVELAGEDRGTGALRIGGRGEARFVVDVLMLVVENGDRVDAFRDRWRGRVITGPSDGGAGHYLIGNASYYLNMAPVQEAVRAVDALPDGATYTFSSLDAMGTFGTALRAQQEGFDARVLWLDEEGGSP